MEKKSITSYFQKKNLNNHFKNKFSINLTAVEEEKTKSRNKRIGHRRQISDSFHRDIIENIKIDNMAEGINNMTVKDAIEEKKEEEENKINEDDKEADLLNINNNKDIFEIELDNKKIELRNDNKNISEQLKEKSKKLEVLENEIKLINKKYAKREEEYLGEIENYKKKILIIQKEKQDLINKLNNSKINIYKLGIINSDLNKKIKEKENELKNLKNELKDYEQKFDIENIIINNLKKNKDEFINKIDMLEKEVINLNNKLNSQNRINRNEMMCVNFTSSDQNINYSIPCTSSDIFAELEEKLYKEYPKYPMY